MCALNSPRYALIVAATMLASASFTTSAAGQQLTATRVRIPAPARIGGIVSCNPSDRRLETIQLAAALGDAVADHHRLVPIRTVDRTGPLEDSPAPQAPPATDVATPQAANLSLVASVALASARGLTSVVGEPSVATRGQEAIYTGNWYSAFSTDGGNTFNCVDPGRTFQLSSQRQEFCCDQVVVYSPQHDVMIWLLQYSRWAGERPNQVSTENIHRLAVAAGDDIRAQRWRYYDLTPTLLGGSAGEWFDYPDLAVSGDFLYLTSNAFETGGNVRFTRSVAARFPLRQLRRYEALDAEHVTPPEAGTLKLARGATSTMHFATHVKAGAAQYVRVYSWADTAPDIRTDDVLVQRWATGGSPAVAPGPDGNDWLARRDGRITAGWLAGTELGFAWTAANAPPFRYPHIRVVLVDTTSMAAVAQPHIWNNAYAYAYPAAAPNGAGAVGLGVAYGGNALYPSFAVGILDGAAGARRWRVGRVAAGTNGPAGDNNEGKWGDYLAVQPHPRDAGLWVAAGFTLQGGNTSDHIEPRYVAFRSGAGPVLTEEEAAARLVRESRRLEAIWQQQPDNVAAMHRAMERLGQAVEFVTAAERQTKAPPIAPQDKFKMIEDTYRPTPADTAAPEVNLTDAQLKQLRATAVATLKQLDASIKEGRTNVVAERRAMVAFSDALKTIK